LNNWHNSLRKVKNCNKGKSGRKDFFGSLAGRKRGCIFSAKDVAKNVREKSNEEKEEQEGTKQSKLITLSSFDTFS
jgi:hypothetical protein